MIRKKRQYGFRIQTINFWPQSVIVLYSLTVGQEKRRCYDVKIGDRFKDKITGKVYIIRMEINNETVRLEGENGLGRRLTSKKSLKRTCEELEDIKS